METFPYFFPGADIGKLHDEITAAGLPLSHISGDGGQIYVAMTRELTQLEVDLLDLVVGQHDGRPRRPRTIWAILQDLAPLAGPDLAAIWADLAAGSPPRLALAVGRNAAAIWVLHLLVAVGTLTPAERNDARRRAVAFYAQDHPAYLVRPPFAPGVNVPGDEPYTV